MCLQQQQQLRRLTFPRQEACHGCGGKYKQYNRESRDDGIECHDTFTVLRRHRAQCWKISQLCSCVGPIRPIHCESCQERRPFPEVEARKFKFRDGELGDSGAVAATTICVEPNASASDGGGEGQDSERGERGAHGLSTAGCIVARMRDRRVATWIRAHILNAFFDVAERKGKTRNCRTYCIPGSDGSRADKLSLDLKFIPWDTAITFRPEWRAFCKTVFLRSTIHRALEH